jgi:hypothetical protein
VTEAAEGALALEKATFSELAAFEVQCPLRGEHVDVPSNPVLFELEAFPSKLIQSPVCSSDCGAPPPTARAATCKTYKTYRHPANAGHPQLRAGSGAFDGCGGCRALPAV